MLENMRRINTDFISQDVVNGLLYSQTGLCPSFKILATPLVVMNFREPPI